MKNTYIFFVLLILLNINLFAQQSFLLGFQKEISGTNFTYHSPFSDNEKSLLVRANKQFDPIIWDTKIIPESYAGKNVSFTWLYAIDVTPEPADFNLFINGDYKLTFSNPLNNDQTIKTITGNNGVSLSLHRTLIDKHNDQMGYAVLQLPVSSVQKGKPIQIKVEGVDKNSNVWYMTFKLELKESVSVKQLKTVTKVNGMLMHTARFEFRHLGEKEKVNIRFGDLEKNVILNPGMNVLDFEIPAVDKPTLLEATITRENKTTENINFLISPVKEWTIYMVQHTHTDIGYTRSQSEILAEHLRFIDVALDYCDQTDNYPDEAKFRWTCEASWAVKEYLMSRPKSQIDRLVKRINEGRIEVTGLYFNYSEIVDEAALAMQTQTLNTFRQHNIKVTSAMQNDVNGIGWCMIDFFKNTGVKYLIMGQHGHRAHVPFDKPTPFWWESPSGNRLLAYRSEHYMQGNNLNLTSENINIFQSSLSEYLDQLEQNGYSYNRTAFQFSGYVTDNAPPSTKACDIVKQWNEKFEWPKLKLAVASEFMGYLEQNMADSLPVKRVAWPDWWADGFGSAMTETKVSRNAHAQMISNMGLLSMAKILGAEIPENINDEITECYDNILFYDEHTFGAAESISDPYMENSVVQWGQKSAYAWTALKQASLIQEKALGSLQSFFPKSILPQIVVFNTLNWSRSGLVDIYIDHEILPLGRSFEILDDNGNSLHMELKNSRNDGSYWTLYATDAPPFGYSVYQIKVDTKTQNLLENNSANSPELMENQFYKLQIDTTKGVINQITDKELNMKLIDNASTYKLGEFIYETLENRVSMERLTAQNRDTIYIPLKKQLQFLSNITIIEQKKNSIWQSLKFNGKLPDCSEEKGVTVEIKLYNNQKKIDLNFSTYKLPVTTPEAIYVSFPFKLGTNDELYFEGQGGLVYPGINQLEGTSSDWNIIQNFAAVRNNTAQIIFTSNHTPLVQFGDINTGHFYYMHKPERSHIYSWVLNNYWTTNFKADQQGEIKWSYSITSASDISTSNATQTGWSNRIPLTARVIPAGKTNAIPTSKSTIDLDLKNLLLVYAKPALTKNGIILHLRETEGKPATLDIAKLKEQTHTNEIYETNILEDQIKLLNGLFLINAFETKFIYLKLE